jgi:hypothetical protein
MLMALTLRPTGGHARVYRDYRQDWTIYDDSEPVGRIYEDTSASTSADLRWFWSITVYVDPKAGITTSGKVPSLGHAKADWMRSWTAWGDAQGFPKKG